MDLKFVVVLMAVLAVVSCAGNATTTTTARPGAPTTPATPTTTTRRPNVLRSLAKAIVDIPIGIAESCRDGAQAFESFLGSFFG